MQEVCGEKNGKWTKAVFQYKNQHKLLTFAAFFMLSACFPV